MKYLLYLLTLIIVSCNHSISEESGQTNKQESLGKTSFSPPPPLIERINRSNKDCLAEIERAKFDAKNGKLVYSLYGMGKKVHNEELEELLKRFNIAYKPLGMNCTGELNCYGLYMDSLITKEYGKTFISSLSKIADHMFESRWATKTYEFWDLKVEPSYEIAPDSFILSKLTFPKGWDFGPIHSERQYINAEVVVDTLGTISDIKVGAFSYNLKSTNKKYLGLLKIEIKEIIKEMKPWKPAELNGHKVKCWFLIDIDLDKKPTPIIPSGYISPASG